MKADMQKGQTHSKTAPAWTGPAEHLNAILSLMSDLVVSTDRDGAITWVNPAFERQSGYSLALARGRHIIDITIGPDGDPHTFAQITQAMAAMTACAGETTCTSNDGTAYHVSFDMKPLMDADGQALGFLFMHRVVTEQRALESALRSEQYFLTKMIDTGVSAVAAFDAKGRCVFANSEAREILDRLTRAERLCAASWPLARITLDAADTDAADIPAAESADDAPDELPFARVTRTGKPVHDMMVALLLPDAPRRIFSVNAAPLRDSETTARVVMALTDITARFEAEVARRSAAAQARFDARHDALTGLANGRHFNNELARATCPFTVIFIDIDNFRSIRTVLGRSVGDALLCAFGERLSQVLGARGLLARSEGNAFVIRLDHATPEAADALAQEFHSALQHAFVLEQITVYATASIGLSHHPADTDVKHPATQDLLRQAEVANFAAKSAGGNRQARYNPDMDARLSRHNIIIQALRQALQHNQFELAFQPKFGLAAGTFNPTQPHQLIGAEALLRWNAPKLGRISPEEFIPIAEAAGVISDIDFHVMAIFARQLGQWRANWHGIPASINLSPRSFEDSTLAPRLIELLKNEGVAAESVTVEITETALISMSDTALANINQFRQAGINLSIDDFGTGYSSFSYLQKFFVSEIKIDKSFVHLLPSTGKDSPATDNPGTRTIVRSILALARTLGIRVVAEGVETAGQLAWLQQEGCHAIQGFLGGRAVSPKTFEQTYLRPARSLGPIPAQAGKE